MTSLVGYSGAGKSTILNLIPRFYDASNGNIIIDGNSIYDLKIESLRSNISLVSQDITLFDELNKKGKEKLQLGFAQSNQESNLDFLNPTLDFHTLSWI